MEMEAEVFITKKVTNKDIYNVLKKQGKVQEEILDHAKITNGRIGDLEKKSIGMWIYNNPFRFTVMAVILLLVVVSDLRHPIINVLKGLL